MAKKASASPVTKKKKEVFDYQVEIESSGVLHKAEGNDPYELLRAFPMPALVKTETNIKVTKEGKTVQRDLKVADARRCFTGFETTSLELLAISINKQLP
jgi:hypothetical protein